VKLGAIVVVGNIGTDELLGAKATDEVPFCEALACADVVGISTVERTVERFLKADVDVVSVLVDAEIARLPQWSFPKNVKVEIVDDMRRAINQRLMDFSCTGVEHSFVNSADTYTETDLLDLFYFHKEARQTITQARDHQGPLALWVVDCEKAQPNGFERLFENVIAEKTTGETVRANTYLIREYVNRLVHPRDLRRLAEDTLKGLCERGPSGREISPGIWIDDGADVHRGARIVGPAYIGRGSKVLDNVLVTRLSSIERSCRIDCGTVIEDSCILANTQVGIWLDVCHAVVNGNQLWSLGREIMIEISDPTLLQSTSPAYSTRSSASSRHETPEIFDNSQDAQPSGTWQFGIQSYPRLSEE
jgi:NDP-sugar pyrophosphorylase family protein